MGFYNLRRRFIALAQNVSRGLHKVHGFIGSWFM